LSIWASGKQAQTVRARSLLCCWAVNALGLRQAGWSEAETWYFSGGGEPCRARGRGMVNVHGYEIENL